MSIPTSGYINTYWPADAGNYQVCNCVGPQRGEPLCPCRMKSVIVRDGRYIMPERDLGPVRGHGNGYTAPSTT